MGGECGLGGAGRRARGEGTPQSVPSLPGESRLHRKREGRRGTQHIEQENDTDRQLGRFA